MSTPNETLTRKSVLLLLVGLLGPAAAAAQAPAWSDEQTISVQLSNFKFSPSEITLQAGKPYRLHLENAASHAHDFSSADFFGAVDIRPADQAKVKEGRIEVGGGQSVDVELVPKVRGEYRLRCTHFMHSSFGMTGSIVVN
jgi:uncharacterized cupredoxin-like copper-binding protein